jgi:quinone-modifying oxidoreductase subunit QmoC
LADWAFISFAIYFVHLVLVWALFAYLPFSKLAHLVYRTVAMAYNEYAGRNF